MSEPGRDLRLIGQSPPIQSLEAEVRRAAQSNAKVLITGETGAGKEVVARLIHRYSLRGTLPLLTLNCAGLPDSLLESELFGHARGSFTGAYRDKPGLFESARGGTVFLDEVGEMSARMQAVLLRFLETGELQRVGGDGASIRADVRLITATNRDLKAEVQAGRFREDLYFRLNVVHLVVPPLRDRDGDVPLLIRHFFEQFSLQHRLPPAVLSPEAMSLLSSYSWPGNVRELKNVVERVVLKVNGGVVRPAELPADVLRSSAPAPSIVEDRGGPAAGPPSPAAELTSAMVDHGESFWLAVYPKFMARDLTRADLRRIIETGLERTHGNYRLLVQLYNMPEADYKRFLSFLRKHDCHLPFQRFRVASAKLPAIRALRAAK